MNMTNWPAYLTLYTALIIGTVLIGYWIIRLAVRHAIRDTKTTPNVPDRNMGGNHYHTQT